MQWKNLQQIKRFVSLMQLYIICEKSGGLHLAEMGLKAGRLADKMAGWQICARVEILNAVSIGLAAR